MNVNAQRLLDRWHQMVATESGSMDGAGIDGVGAILADALASAGCEVEVAGSAASGGHHLRARRDGAGQPVLLLGHMDTVWARGTLARNPYRIEAGRMRGPGVADMKGGLAVLLEAVAATADLPNRPALRVGLTADEELGSPTGRELVEELAVGASACLVFESGRPDGSLIDRRGSVGIVELTIDGRTAHVAHDPEAGINAVDELAYQLLRLGRFRDFGKGESVMAGIVRGGTARQVVPDHAEALVDLRAPTTARMKRLVRSIRGVRPHIPGALITVTGGMTRPAMEPGPQTEALRSTVDTVAAELEMHIGYASTRGGSDGSFAAALGVPTLDGFGPIGERICSLEESAIVDSGPERARLVAGVLERLGSIHTMEGRP